MLSDFVIEPFQPAWRSPHVQTFLANTFRSSDGVRFERVRIGTPDGDFLDLDFARVPGYPVPRNAPVVLGMHGLEGNARRPYLCETYIHLAKNGVRAVGMNYRSCSGVPNRTARLYHSGATDDVQLVVNWLAHHFPGVPLGAVGFSLGANMLLKYLGEQGERTPLTAAAAVSPPFDLLAGADTFESGMGRLYANSFLRGLREKVTRHAHLIGGIIDLDRALSATTFREFDDAVTAPLGGFASAEEYYLRCSCGPFVPAVRIPTLVLRALDDPFFAPYDVPHRALAENPMLLPHLTPVGGHVAFFEGRWPKSMSFWAERQAARFLTSFLRPAAAE